LKLKLKLNLVLVLLLLMPVETVFAGEQLSFNDIKLLAEQGNAKAQAQYGAINFLGDDFQLKPSARFKTKQAFKAISYLLEGVPSDYEVATKWLLKAANQNYIDAEVFMAAMYDRGMGVKQDPSEATRLYTKASKQGNETAAAILGRYANSRLVASRDIPVTYALKILNTE
jgi:TPR repeat protein